MKRNGITKGRRVRRNTSEEKNLEVDEMTFENIKRFANKSNDEISRRIA